MLTGFSLLIQIRQRGDHFSSEVQLSRLSGRSYLPRHSVSYLSV